MDWSEGRLRSFIVGVLRAGARRWPPKWQALEEAYAGKKKNEKTGRVGKHYLCAGCNKEYPAKDVEVDHILPVVDPDVGFIDWNTFISRLYCPKENLQILCQGCHKRKTNEERKQSKSRKER